MTIQQNLTKENFWNGMMERFPKATKHFCNWIDEYKKAVEWDRVFGNSQVKFHHIPYDMQKGVWLECKSQNYLLIATQYVRSLRDDIEKAFKFIELYSVKP